MTQAIELLNGNTDRNLASRQALIDACNKVAYKIINAFPYEEGVPDTLVLPRGYRLTTNMWTFRPEGELAVRYLAPPEPKDDVAINHSRVNNDSNMWHIICCDKGGDGVDNAPRPVLLAFAQDCATGLIEEIAAFVADVAAQNERGLSQLAAV